MAFSSSVVEYGIITLTYTSLAGLLVSRCKEKWDFQTSKLLVKLKFLRPKIVPLALLSDGYLTILSQHLGS